MQDRGILLSYIKYGDSDAVIHCFTRDKGCASFFVKGLYAKNNKKKAYLTPLNELEFSISIKGKSLGIQSVTKIEAVSLTDFYQDVRMSSIAFFIADFLNQILKNEGQNLDLYTIIKDFIEEMQNGNYQCHLVFLVRILAIQGLIPLFSEATFLNPESGNFSHQQRYHLFDDEISHLWKTLISTEFPYQITIPPQFRKSFLDSLMIYYHCHYSDFHIPKSLQIVRQIFE